MEFSYKLTFWKHVANQVLLYKAYNGHLIIGILILFLLIINIPSIVSSENSYLVNQIIVLMIALMIICIVGIITFVILMLNALLDKFYFKQVGKTVFCEINEEGIRETAGEKSLFIAWEDMKEIRCYNNIFIMNSNKSKLLSMGLSNAVVDSKTFIEVKKCIELWGKDKIVNKVK